MSHLPPGRWFDDDSFPDISDIRARRPDVDAELTRRESVGRVRAASSQRPMCFGVLIIHGRASAVAAGVVVFECSRGDNCRDLHMEHASPGICWAIGNGHCPACDPEP